MTFKRIQAVNPQRILIIKRWTLLTFIFLAGAILLLAGCKHRPQANVANTPVADLPVITLSYNGVSATKTSNVLTVNEAVGTVIIRATLSKPSTEIVSLLFWLNPDPEKSTAVINNDFSLPPPNGDRDLPLPENSMEVFFVPGTDFAEIKFTLVSDNLYEGDEQLSFWVIPNRNGTIDLPIDPSTRPFMQLNITEKSDPPNIKISKIKIGSTEEQSVIASNFPDIKEGQSLAITIAATSANSLDTKIQFELIPESATRPVEGIDYDFPFAENKLVAGGTSSEIFLPAEESSITFTLPIYARPFLEDPKRLYFSLLGSEGSIPLDSNGVTNLEITIIDDGNNGININDTSISTCYDNDANSIDCADNSSSFPNQDGATNTEPQFVKYDSILSAPLADTADAKCIYDTNTGLLWQVITEANRQNQYAWYNDNPTNNGGLAGQIVDQNVDTGQTPLGEKTQDYLNTLNGQGLCDVTEWRLPKLNELLSIFDFETPGDNPVFANKSYFDFIRLQYNYFNTSQPQATYYWTASPSAISKKNAWCVTFKKITKDSAKLCDKENDELPAIMVSNVGVIP